MHPFKKISSEERDTGVYYSTVRPNRRVSGATYRVATVLELRALSTKAVLYYTILASRLPCGRVCVPDPMLWCHGTLLWPRRASLGWTRISRLGHIRFIRREGSLNVLRSGRVSLPLGYCDRIGLACSSWPTTISLIRVSLSGHCRSACLVHSRSARESVRPLK